MLRFLRPVFVISSLLALAPAVRAQWAVYELRFSEEAGSVNFSFYSGAYVVVPVKGGAASIVFTTESGGNYYAASENSLRYYAAMNQGVKQAVLSAFTINGTAQAFYSAAGNFDTTVEYTDAGVTRTAGVPASLTGMLLASDDESFKGPASDGSLGMIGRASIKAALRQDLTQITNGSAITMGDAVKVITGLLEKYGYRPDVGDAQEESGAQSAPAASVPSVEAGGADVTALFGGQSQTTVAAESAVPVSAEVTPPALLPPAGDGNP
ncbi:MAG: hypothetical protein K1X78_21625 [Verrucomicrobiaceae bacterium]|nr:hypothetical protein [Verrucomicrobiaceae bacterium]